MTNKGRVLAAFVALGALAWLYAEWSVPFPFETSDPYAGAPRVEVALRERNFGAVSQGELLRTTIPLTNRGSRRLVLVPLNQPCCGQDGLPELVVPPATSVEIPVELDTAQWFGDVRHVVEYATNDPRAPRLTFTLKARVE